MEQPAATFYAACGTNNLLSRVYDSVLDHNFLGEEYVDGYLTFAGTNTIISPDEGDPYPVTQTTLVADNAYDCCVQCITNVNCGGGFFLEDGSNQCTFSSPVHECDPNAYGGVVTAVDAENPNHGTLQVTVFDGNCGQVLQLYPGG